MLQNISRTKVWMFLFSLLSLKIENHFFLFFQNRLDPSGSPQKISFWNIGSKCIHPFWMEGRNKINLVLPKKFPSPTVWSASHSSTLQLAECSDDWQKIMEPILKTTNCRFFSKPTWSKELLWKNQFLKSWLKIHFEGWTEPKKCQVVYQSSDYRARLIHLYNAQYWNMLKDRWIQLSHPLLASK